MFNELRFLRTFKEVSELAQEEPTGITVQLDGQRLVHTQEPEVRAKQRNTLWRVIDDESEEPLATLHLQGSLMPIGDVDQQREYPDNLAIHDIRHICLLELPRLSVRIQDLPLEDLRLTI